MSDTEYCRYEIDESLPGELEGRPCNRTVWEDASNGYCIWHTDQKDKPAKELLTARVDDQERLDRAKLRATDLTDVPLKSAGLVKANLRYTNLEEKDLREADLRKADLLGANLAGADFRAAEMWQVDFREADVSNANFRCADCTGSILRGVDLSGENCHRVDLSEADLQNVSAERAGLFEADIRKADCRDATLTEANLRHADCSGADFSDADLRHAYLTGADLSNASLRDADLSNATLRDADFSGADLRNVDLRDCSMERATLSGADLRGADLTGAEIHDVDFSGVEVDRRTDFDVASVYEPRGDRAATGHDGSLPSFGDAPLKSARLRAKRFLHRLKNGGEDFAGNQALEKSVDSNRTIQRLLRNNSVTEQIPEYHVQEKQAQRKLRLSEGQRLRWMGLAAHRWVMLYGERPWRVVGTSLLIIIGSAYVYTIAPFKPNGTFLDNLYFSMITFTTLGYGDLTPQGWGRALAMFESFIGMLLASLLLFVLTRRATR
ncbi:pentapeptide repeat-containing protein [Halorussus aquaticus]|uniref:Pentapeptide repeat-containing protein n=1 Tax=Halorussus aquaticus TaxID=2953748 RepID=A0ABD5Q2P2_9EURY|nr:pentapeptide repeat-containing protein [Halorussus aquaticus]